MKNKNEVKKTFDLITKDVLDHYNEYDLQDKAAIIEQVKKFEKLNNLLKIYDDKVQKEEIKTILNLLIENILDNYEDYSDHHKDLVKEEMLSFEALNLRLDKYDKVEESIKKKSLWEKFKNLVKWS